MARQKKTSSKNRSFLLPVAGLLCFAAAGLWWMSSAPVAETTSAPPASQPDPYEQFVASSLKNGWTPTDPVEKLSATVAKFGQVLEPADLKSSNDLLKMLVQEFEYVVKVLIRTPKRKFDLSHLLEDTLEMLKIAYFKSMKHQLKAGARTITRMQIDARAVDMHVLYAVLQRTVLALPKIQVNHTNIAFDVLKPNSKGHSLFTMAVRYRLYPMISWLSMQGCHCAQDDSLKEAVLNGDSTTVAMLLNDRILSTASKHPSHLSTILRIIDENMALALSLKNIRVKEALALAVGKLNGNVAAPAGPTPVGNDFLAVNTARCVELWGEHLTESGDLLLLTSRCLSVEEDKEENQVNVVSTADGTNEVIDGSNPLEVSKTISTFDIRGWCDVPVYNLKLDSDDDTNDNSTSADGIESISIAKFKHNFVKRNRPVILRGLLSTSSADDWSLMNLFKASSTTEVQVGQIPYQPLFEETTEKSRQQIGDFLNGHGGHVQKLIKWWQQQYTPNGNISAHTINNLSIDQFGGLFVQGDDSDYDFPPLPNYVFDNEMLGRKGHARAFWNLFARDDEKKTQDKKAKRYLERAMYQILSAISRDGSESEDNLETIHTTGQFFVGPLFSGAPFHYHGPAVNVLAKGKKIWTLLPPGNDLYSRLHPLQWSTELRRAYNKQSLDDAEVEVKQFFPYIAEGSPCSIVQEEGDTLFVPRHWSHQILNVGDENVGFAVEVH